jgi:predicted Zn-dependent peptidase
MAGTQLVHCAMIVNAGARDESAAETGIAHFLEHMLFKGTRRRKAYHILNRIDAVGGDLNAYTTQERTIYHATVPAEYAERAIELLQDIAFYPSFPAHEIRKEQQVVLDELEMYEDTPEEYLLDCFDEFVFPDHAIGRPVLGYRETVKRFDQVQLQQAHRHLYQGQQMLLMVAGNLSPRKFDRLMNKYFSWAPNGLPALQRQRPQARTGGYRKVKRPVQQTHLMIGGEAYDVHHPRRAAFQLLMHYLGGNSMNNLLSLRIREKHGIGYNLYSFYQPFSDCGIFGIYAACEPQRQQRLEQLIHRLLASLRQQPVSEQRLRQLKRQYLGMMRIQRESHFNLMMALGQDWLDFGRLVDEAEICAEIEALTPADLQAAAQAMLAPERLNTLIHEPDEHASDPPDP